MRKIYLLIGLILLVNEAKAQILISLIFGDKLNSDKIEFGLDGGFNYSTITSLSGKIRPNFNLGFYFDFKLKQPSWKIHTGVLVKSNMGYRGLPVYSLNNSDLDNAFVGGSIDRKLSYFNVPVMIKYTIPAGFYLEAGFMAGLRTKAEDIFIQDIRNKDDLTFLNDVDDEYGRIDAGLIGGIGYRLMGGKGMNLGIRYYLGAINIVKDDSLPSQYNRSFYIAVGIPIGAGKKKTNTEN